MRAFCRRIGAAFEPHPAEYPLIPFCRGRRMNKFLNVLTATLAWAVAAAAVVAAGLFTGG